MQFLWYPLLVLFALVPLLLAVYVRQQRRRRRYALRYASVSLIKPALDRRARYRRHLPPALFLTALGTLIIALARPTTVVRAPSEEGTVILALDASGSMRADDIKPNRFQAALAAARTFVQHRPSSTQIGIVAFGGSAVIVQTPTNDKDALIAAINRLNLQRGTAVGSAIIASLNAIAAGDDDQVGVTPNPADLFTEEPKLPPVAPGTFIPAVVILLTDGRSNRGIDPLDAARLAAERGVRVYTVGIGTKTGARVPPSFGGGGTFGVGFFADLDEESLRAIADLTQAEYFYAADAQQLDNIYSTLGKELTLKVEKLELTAWFTALAAMLMLAAFGLTLLWNTLT